MTLPDIHAHAHAAPRGARRRTADEAELERIFVEVLPGMVRARDIPGYVSLFTEDAAWCPPNAPDRFGHAGITVGITGVLADQDIDPYFTADQVVVHEPAFGYVFGTSKEILKPHDGSPSTVAYSRELWLFRRTEAGWKISHLVFNLKPPPAPGARRDTDDSAARKEGPMAMTTRFWTPANIQDFSTEPDKQDRLNEYWSTNLSGFTQQGILGNPWSSANQSNQTLYFDPLTAGPSTPGSYTVTAVQWSPLPGRIGFYFPQLLAEGVPSTDYYALADTGYDTSGKTFGQITSNPCVSIMSCSGSTTEQPYGPYGPRGWQDEYCEWAVTRGAPTEKYPLGPITRIDFTCENPEYWNTLWLVDPDRVVDLYRSTLGKPQIEAADLYLLDGSGDPVIDPTTGRPAYNPLNKWNSGSVSTPTQGGAMHLTSTPNTLQTEIQLGAGATVQRKEGASYSANELLCCGQYGQVARNSDPNIGQGVNGLVGATPPPAPNGSTVSLANPPGLYIQPPDWSVFKTPDGTSAEKFWTVARGATSLTDQNGVTLPGQFILHATFEVPEGLGYTVSDILVNGANVVYAAQIVYTMQMHILAASFPLTSPPPQLDCVWCCTSAPAPSYAQPLQLFHAAVWSAMYPVMVPNPVGNPISLASNSTLIAPFAKAGSTYQMVLTVAGATGTPAVAATLGGQPDPAIQIEVKGSSNVTYAVPGNTYPSPAVALSLEVTIGAGAATGVRGITVTNPGDPVQPAMPALLNVV